MDSVQSMTMSTTNGREDFQHVLHVPKFPKLKYRNQQVKDPDTETEEASLPSISRDSSNTESAQSSKHDLSIRSPSIQSAITSCSARNGQVVLDSQLQPHNQPSAPSNRVKSKAVSLFKYFSVKEPSTQAWLDYQGNVRKQQISGDGRITASGMPMVSTAKLPPTVPKVNSKWDGIPQSVKSRARKGQHNPINRSSPNSLSHLNSSTSRSNNDHKSRRPSMISAHTKLPSCAGSNFPRHVDEFSSTVGSRGLANSNQTQSSIASTTSLPELSPCTTPEVSQYFMEYSSNHDMMNKEDLQEQGMTIYNHSRPSTPLDSSPRTPPSTSPFSMDQQPAKLSFPGSYSSHPHFLVISTSSAPLASNISIDSINSTYDPPAINSLRPTTLNCNSTSHLPQISTGNFVSEQHPRTGTSIKSRLEPAMKDCEREIWNSSGVWKSSHQSQRTITATPLTKPRKAKVPFLKRITSSSINEACP